MRISDWSSDVCSSDLDRRDDRLEADRRVGRVDRDEKTAGKAREGGADAEADGVDALDVDAQGLRRVRVLRGGADRLSEAGEADEGPQREAGGGGDADDHQALIGDEQRSQDEGALDEVGHAAARGADEDKRQVLPDDEHKAEERRVGKKWGST